MDPVNSARDLLKSRIVVEMHFSKKKKNAKTQALVQIISIQTGTKFYQTSLKLIGNSKSLTIPCQKQEIKLIMKHLRQPIMVKVF